MNEIDILAAKTATGAATDETTDETTEEARAERYVSSLPDRCFPAGRNMPESPVSEETLRRGIGVTGGGLMGISISAAFLKSGIPVLMYDVSEEAIQTAPRRLRAELALQMPNATQSELDEAAARFVTTTEPERLAAFVFIVESIYEKPRIKAKHYAMLDSKRTTPAYVMSNTSTIRIGLLAEAFAEHGARLSASRFCGFHFFHPVRERSLLEVIRGKSTSDATMVLAVQAARLIGKTPILVHDGPGFLVNRLLNPYLNESLALLEEGVAPMRIENVCRRFGMQMGPFRVMDEIGLDVTLHSGWSIRRELPDAVTAERVLTAMLTDHRFGRKNGRGFYAYRNTDTLWQDDGVFDPTLEPLVSSVLTEEEREKARTDTRSDEELALRVFLPILMEAGRIVEAGIVSDFALVDAALVLGLGFPRNKGGICFWADRFGLAVLVGESRKRIALGRRYEPPQIFIRAIENNQPLVRAE